MNAVATTGPFFEYSNDEARFCFFHAPHDGDASREPVGAVLAVHAFAEEMNKTRAAVAEGARALAGAGYAVLQIDLAGCGDSAGDFEDATWDGWLEDLDLAWQWLVHNTSGPRWLWGTRLGGLLADDFAGRCMPEAEGLLLWQPVVNGAQHLGQFLRMKTVNNLLRQAAVTTTTALPAGTSGVMSAADPSVASIAGVAQASPRADLAAGRSVEVAGYRLTPALADAIEAARLGARESVAERRPPRVRWFEVSSQAAATMSPVASRVADRWRASGRDVEVRTVVGNAFWQTIEIERCQALVDATVASLAG